MEYFLIVLVFGDDIEIIIKINSQFNVNFSW